MWHSSACVREKKAWARIRWCGIMSCLPVCMSGAGCGCDAGHGPEWGDAASCRAYLSAWVGLGVNRTPQPFSTVTEGIRKSTTHVPGIRKLYTCKLDDLGCTFDRSFILGLGEDAISDEVAQEKGNHNGRCNATRLRPESNVKVVNQYPHDHKQTLDITRSNHVHGSGMRRRPSCSILGRSEIPP